MAESPNTSQRPEVRIAPATNDDLPGIAICELLAFSGAFPPYETLARLLNPFRAPLVQAGVHPRHWPDYTSTIRECATNLRDGSMISVAFAKDENGQEIVAGVAKMTPPKEIIERFRKSRKWKERVLDDIVYPTINNMRDKLWKDSDGTDTRCLAVFKKERYAAKDRIDKDRRYFYLNLFHVHPAFQGRGIGSALLAHCVSISDAHGIPMMLESSTAGVRLYQKHGFVKVDSIDFTFAGEHIVSPCMVRQPVAPPVPPKDEGQTIDSSSDDDLYVEANS
ncbi:hypothetical protein A7U60_g5949 [Sanghuangporus baumii]|uniref:N-acetyltransferase domain-containing protein n=1 Tax=Sanghuangporus baumii TaxID=108892 RepID=A0A9Q5HWB3_SANBA|nr:hypothetical protein A7U60_g5949 [Sanghuangporus baumii]